jgi:hypothetical protein
LLALLELLDRLAVLDDSEDLSFGFLGLVTKELGIGVSLWVNSLKTKIPSPKVPIHIWVSIFCKVEISLL